MLSLLAPVGLGALAPAALAAPTGPPVADPARGLVGIAFRGDAAQVPTRDRDCGDAVHCEGMWRRLHAVAEADLALLPGLGLFGEAGWGRTRMREADYRGDGLLVGGGLRLAVPVAAGFHAAAVGRFERVEGEGAALETGGHESARLLAVEASGLVAWRDVSGAVQLWTGARGAAWWSLSVWPLGRGDLELPMDPVLPLSAVLGAELASEPLGLGARRSVRIATGLEGSLGRQTGASAWLALRY